VVPVLNEVAKETAEVPTSEVECSPDTESHPSAFQLGANCAPNLRDKVTWNVTQHAWKVQVKKPSAVPRHFFAVDPLLNAADYGEQKVAMYWEAVKHWNLCDGSNRLRIAVPSGGQPSTSPSKA